MISHIKIGERKGQKYVPGEMGIVFALVRELKTPYSSEVEIYQITQFDMTGPYPQKDHEIFIAVVDNRTEADDISQVSIFPMSLSHGWAGRKRIGGFFNKRNELLFNHSRVEHISNFIETWLTDLESGGFFK